jgi:cold shock CspA family protein
MVNMKARCDMVRGSITKLVTSYGSSWGRIKPESEAREVFFNPRSLIDPTEYDGLILGEEVEFEEEPDRANGTHAIRVRSRLAGTLMKG